MKQVTTRFLKLAVIFVGILVLALCIFLVPELAFAVSDSLKVNSLKYIIYTILYGTAIPFYFALYQTFKLLSYIDKNKAFSELSVIAYRKSNTVPFQSVVCMCYACRYSILWRIKMMRLVSYLSEQSFLLLQWLSPFLLLS